MGSTGTGVEEAILVMTKCNNPTFHSLDGLIHFLPKKTHLKYCDIVKAICKYNKKHYCIRREKKNSCRFLF